MLEMYKLLICYAFYRRGQKSTLNNTEFIIYEDKYFSQDLTSILHNTLDVSGGRETEGGGYFSTTDCGRAA